MKKKKFVHKLRTVDELITKAFTLAAQEKSYEPTFESDGVYIDFGEIKESFIATTEALFEEQYGEVTSAPTP